jgi:predicted metal-dependent hydrolase
MPAQRSSLTPSAHLLTYESTAIPYTLRRTRRKTLGIRITPDAAVHVTAPVGATQAAVEEVLRRKAAWIVRKQAEVRAYRPPVPPRQYVSGEVYFYLGKSLRLLVVGDAKSPARGRVTVEGECLCVQTPSPDDAQAVAALIDRWYRRAAAEVFAAELAVAAARVLPLSITAPRTVRIRRMQTRWGSCTAKGAITLNLRLIQADRALIEYVIVHELCHLREHNHSRSYYRLLDQALPDWRARKQRLNATPLP